MSGILILAALLQACATPAQRLHAEALGLGLMPQTLRGEGFALDAYYRPRAGARTPGRRLRQAQGGDGKLHVYLEGDGTPWLTPERVAQDPTPRNPLMLRLMAMDRAAVLYLGRPCYNGHAQDPGCSPAFWTHRRYGPEVVAAMSAALRGFLTEHPHTGLIFMGHSGGGVLALLMARRFPQTRLVTTLAAPLDIDAWTDHHGYSRLDGSLNPAKDPPAPFREIHYFGAQDARAPAALFEHALAKRPGAQVSVFEHFDHVCCWERIWPDILRRLASQAEGL